MQGQDWSGMDWRREPAERRDGRAPLAVRESFESRTEMRLDQVCSCPVLVTDTGWQEEGAELREFWSYERSLSSAQYSTALTSTPPCSAAQYERSLSYTPYEKPRELKLPTSQTWAHREFYDLSRKQQNLKMYKAIAPVVKQMLGEWDELVATLRDIERRIEILQIHQVVHWQPLLECAALHYTTGVQIQDSIEKHYFLKRNIGECKNCGLLESDFTPKPILCTFR